MLVRKLVNLMDDVLFEQSFIRRIGRDAIYHVPCDGYFACSEILQADEVLQTVLLNSANMRPRLLAKHLFQVAADLCYDKREPITFGGKHYATKDGASCYRLSSIESYDLAKPTHFDPPCTPLLAHDHCYFLILCKYELMYLTFK